MSTAAAEPYLRAHGISRGGIALVVALHLAVVWLLLQMNVIGLPTAPAVLSVSLIRPETPMPPQPEVTPPKPKPVAKREMPAPQPQPVPLALPVAAPAPTAPAAPMAPPAAPAAAPVAAAAPAPVVPSAPRFDADYLDNPKPVYPPLSRRLGEEGKVVLRVHVEPSGRPSQIEIKTGSGSPRLDQAALDAVWRWKFVPARRGDEAVAAWVLVPIVFNLSN